MKQLGAVQNVLDKVNTWLEEELEVKLEEQGASLDTDSVRKTYH